jgi:hypothetical protein
MQYLIEPVRLSFHGRDADRHRMDALWLGQSLQGTAKVYNSVAHFLFLEQVKASSRTSIRVQVGPPKEGSIFYLIYMLMTWGHLPVFPDAFYDLAELAVPEFVKSMIAKTTGQDALVEKMIEQNHELLKAFQERGFKTEDRLLDMIEKLALQNRGALADMSAAVGRTASRSVYASPKVDPFEIDEATADALRSKKDLRVGEMVTIRGVLSKVDKKTGAFRLQEMDSGREITGRITDPSLYVIGNIYTHALDTALPIVVSGKPTLDEKGEIQKLFVSDAKNAE